MKRCARCKLEKPIDDFYNDRSQGDGKDRRCIECAKAHLVEVKTRNGDKMRASRRARHKERMANDPAYRDRVRKGNRERRRAQRAADPERNRQYVRNRYEKLRSDPEKWAAFLAKKREYVARLKTSDPDKYEALLEARRINNRLRRIELGLPVRKSKAVKNGVGRTTKLDAAPLVPLIEEWIDRYEIEHSETPHRTPTIKVLSERSGVSDRLILRIRKGQEKVALDTADKLCLAIDVPLSMIYSGDEDE